MRSTVKKWGNSASIRIPAAVLEAANLQLDSEVDIREEAGKIVIEAYRPRTYDIDALLGGITTENLHDEEGFGPPVGKETL
jgi:antitoxin MazE